MTGGSPLVVDPEAAAALAEGRPVVALESTVITHGLPWPVNLETARAVVADVRTAGAVPATVAVLNGRLRVGLSNDELETLARAGTVAKVSRRDLAAALTSGAPGGTTVSATMVAAHAAGIAVFATGGIGGVHRGAETSFDVSADLEELARTPVAVVCAGAKAILDLPKTLEYLETRGVPIIGAGTDRFPAFFVADSGLSVDHRCDDAARIAQVIALHRSLGLNSGLVIAQPCPADAALDRAEVEAWIDTALAEADGQGVRGKAVTPFLLSQISALSDTRSLRANIALLRNNARLAGQIAVALGHQAGAPRLG